VRCLNVVEVGSNLFIWSLRGRRLGPAAEGTKGDAVPIITAYLETGIIGCPREFTSPSKPTECISILHSFRKNQYIDEEKMVRGAGRSWEQKVMEWWLRAGHSPDSESKYPVLFYTI